MHDFILREIKDTDIKNELYNIGFDKSYISKGKNKFIYKTIKIYSLSVAQCNIIKQTALSCGADCATNRNVVSGDIDLSDVILTGSISELKNIAQKLMYQPFNLKIIGEKLLNCTAELQPFKMPKIVGVLNITKDSFSDGGMYNDTDRAINHALSMIEDGVDIIDIGAESTRPYSKPVSSEEQLAKLIPVIDFLKDKVTISVDTRSSIVAEECIKRGANIINDVSGLSYDNGMIDVIADYNCPIIIQHSNGTPDIMQDVAEYKDVVEEVYLDLDKKCKLAKSKGIQNIIVDVGIGFGKSRENNFELIRRIGEFKSLGYPVMIGISRKSFLGLEDNLERDIFSAVFNTLAIERKVNYIRVHNVKMHKYLIDLMKMFVV